MSPEVALLVRAALLGLFVFALERLGQRRQAKRAAAERTVIRLSATMPTAEPLAGRPLQVSVRPLAEATTSQAQSGQAEVLQLGPTLAANVTAEPNLYDGHVTEKRAA